MVGRRGDGGMFEWVVYVHGGKRKLVRGRVNESGSRRELVTKAVSESVV